MSPGLLVMLVGVFVVPIAFLWAGHRLRRRTARWRAVFWGALLGYLVGATLSLVASMIPPEMWSAQDTLRGLAGYWALVMCPLLGAALGSTRA